MLLCNSRGEFDLFLHCIYHTASYFTNEELTHKSYDELRKYDTLLSKKLHHIKLAQLKYFRKGVFLRCSIPTFLQPE